MRLITGGSGFLGVVLARLLVEKGMNVRVFDLRHSLELPAEVEFIEGDIRDQEAVLTACRGVSHVYHLAALLPQSKAPCEIMHAVHVTGTENVLRACVQQRVQRMVFLSSSEVYGKMSMIPCPEEAPKKPIGEYGRNKVDCEALCDRYAREDGLKVSVLRPPAIFGPGIVDDGIKMLLEKLHQGGTFPIVGCGKNRVHAIDIADCAQAVYLCGERMEAVGEIFNIGCEEVPALVDMAVEMKKYAGTGARIMKIPAVIGINLLRLLNLFGRSPMEPEHYKLMTSDLVLDISRIKTRLGWSPEKTYMQSVLSMYDWYRQEVVG